MTVVEASAGRVQGVVEGGLSVFRGIPYAAAPIGERRWRAAESHPGWRGTLDATRFGPSAPQPFMPGGDPVLGGHGSPPFDEDCLTLNIWTPAADDAGRPVLLWIHGGGFISGSGSLPYYSGERLARDGDLVVVTINYRLGPLGFLTVEDDEGANYWLTDQVAALRWVHDNIAAFGGDPGQITVGGQSGGALSTAALTGHPEAGGLFRRAIVQSPPFGLDLPNRAESLKVAETLREIVGADLRGVGWEGLVGATMEMFGRTARWGYWPTPYLPILDAATMPRHPAEALARADVDVLIGWTREEANFGFALNPAYADVTQEQVATRAGQRYADYAAARPGAGPLEVLMDLITDELFREPSMRVAQERAAKELPVWAYQFDYPAVAYEGRLGAAHCLDLPFVFGNFDDWSPAPLVNGMDPRTRDGLSAAMHHAWIAFVRTGDPNHAALPRWDSFHEFHEPTDGVLHFDRVIRQTGHV